MKTRSYEGAAGGRRLKAANYTPSALAAQLSGFRTLARRARFLTDNSGTARAGVEAWESALVGSGITPQSKHPDLETRKVLNTAWARWVKDADLDGISDFYGMQATVARRLVIDGEIFAAWSYDEWDGKLKCRLIDAEQCDGQYNYEAPTQRIVAGVEFDGGGRRVAYHMQRARPGLPMYYANTDLVRMPADSVSHVFRVEAAGQVRGVSWFAPVILKLIDLDKATDAQLMRQQVAAMFAGFITDPTGQGLDMDETQDGGQWDVSLEPGLMKFLGPGQDVKFSSPADLGNEAIEFLRVTQREIAAGLGVPYEQITGDLSGVNYSSIRAGLVEFRRRVEKLQWQVLIRHFCEPAWRRFIAAEILSGRIGAPGFEADPEAYLDADWLPPKTEWVDPLKDAQAETLAIDRGLMSRRQAVAARGYNIDDLDREIAEDKQSAAALGLDFSAPQPAKNDGDGKDKEEKKDEQDDNGDRKQRRNPRRRVTA